MFYKQRTIMAKNFLKQVMDKQPEGAIDTKAFIAKIESGYIAGKGQPEFKTKKTFYLIN